MKKKVLIFGHYGVPNWGDEGILKGILLGIDRKKCSITVVSANPEYTKKMHGVESVSPPPFGIRSVFSGWIQGIRAIKQADYILFGGGGLFQPSPLKALRLWDWYLRICLMFQKRIFFVGQSFANVRSVSVSPSQKKRMQQVSFFSVRDEYSAHILESQWGIYPSKIYKSADAVFFLSSGKHSSSVKKQKKIVFCLREGELSSMQESDILRHVHQAFPEHRFVCLVMQSFQSNDERLPERHEHYAWKTVFPQNVQEVMDEIQSATMVVSSRLHGSVFSIVCETPFVALGCRSKISNLIPAYRILFPKDFSHPHVSERLISLASSVEDIRVFRKKEQEKLSLFFPSILV